MANTTALRIEKDSLGRAGHVLLRKQNGETKSIKARVIIVACSAIQSARLLLISELGNNNDQIGRNLVFSTLSAGWAKYKLPHPSFPMRPGLPFLNRSVQDFYQTEAALLPHQRGGTIVFIRPHKNPIFQAELQSTLYNDDYPVFGNELAKRLVDFFHTRETLEYETFSEFFPTENTKVSLNPRIEDKYGLALPMVDVTIPNESRLSSKLVSEKAEAIFRQTGAEELGRFREPEVYYPLQAGTARMGLSPDTSVIDQSGQSHFVKNLYVADGAALPSSGGGPPSLSP